MSLPYRLRCLVLACLFAAVPGAWAQGDAKQLFFDGFELLKAGKATDAIRKFEAGLENEPENAMAYFFLREAYLSAKQQAKAKESFEKSLELDPFGPMGKKANERLTQLATGASQQRPPRRARRMSRRRARAGRSPRPGSSSRGSRAAAS